MGAGGISYRRNALSIHFLKQESIFEGKHVVWVS